MMKQLETSSMNLPPPGEDVLPAGVNLFDLSVIIKRRRGRIITIFLVCILLAGLSMLLPHKWTAETQMGLVDTQDKAQLSNDPDYSPPVPDTIDTELGMLLDDKLNKASSIMLRKTIAALKSTPPPPGVVLDQDVLDPHKLVFWTKIVNPKQSDIIDVDITANSRRTAAYVSDTFCKVFVGWKQDLATRDVSTAIATLQTKVDDAHTVMLQAEQAATNYSLTHDVTVLGPEEAQAIQRLQEQITNVAALAQAADSAKARLTTAEAQLSTANSALSNVGSMRNDAEAELLQSKLNQLEMQRADEATQVTPQYEGILPELDAQIADTKSRLSQALKQTLVNKAPSLEFQGDLLSNYAQAQVAYSSAEAELRSASHIRKTEQAQLSTVPEANMEYALLTEKAQNADSEYTNLLNALNAAQLTKDKIEADVRITHPAVLPDSPTFPILWLNLLLALIVGTIVSAISVSIAEKSDSRVHTLDEMPLPLIRSTVGVLPYIPTVALEGPAGACELSNVAESLNFIRYGITNALAKSESSNPGKAQTIFVTSAYPGEGKSTFAAILAEALMNSGKKVLLIEANFRHPAQYSMANGQQSVGFAEVLSGQIPLEELLPSDEHHLTCLHSGNTSSNPYDLLLSPALDNTLEYMRNINDVIIIDGPNQSTYADTMILAQHADCVIQVVRVGEAQKDGVEASAAAFASIGKSPLIVPVDVPKKVTKADKKQAKSGDRLPPGSGSRPMVVYSKTNRTPAEENGIEHRVRSQPGVG